MPMPKRKKPRKPMKSASFTPTKRQKHDIPAAWRKPLLLQSQLESLYSSDFAGDPLDDPFLHEAAQRVIWAERDPLGLEIPLLLHDAFLSDMPEERLAELVAARNRVAHAHISDRVERRFTEGVVGLVQTAPTAKEVIFTPLGDGAKEMGDEGKHDVASLPDRRHGAGQLPRPIEWPSKHKVSVNRTDRWVESVSFWIPRKNREAIMGDIQEDCVELRKLGRSEWRVRTHVIWQLAVCVLKLWPAALKTALVAWVVTKFREMI